MARKSLSRSRHVDLGLAVLAAHHRHGDRYKAQTIAAVCDCSVSYIRYLEKRALAKLRAIAPGHALADYSEGAK